MTTFMFDDFKVELVFVKAVVESNVAFRMSSGVKDCYHYSLVDFKVQSEPLFEGNQLRCMPGRDIIDVFADILGFLTLRPGETDEEYFDSYSPTQLSWLQTNRCEDLRSLVYEIENRVDLIEREEGDRTIYESHRSGEVTILEAVN
ncbi:MAG: hypothetical protein WBB28_01800 [Crinalium sp.]